MVWADKETKSNIDIWNQEIRDEVNSKLAMVTCDNFLTPYIAYGRIQNLLAQYHIILPQPGFMEGESGIRIHDVNQFGMHFGMDNDGKVKQDGEFDKDETHGEHIEGESPEDFDNADDFQLASSNDIDDQEKELHIYFEYSMNELGTFTIFCEILDNDELEDIKNDLSDDELEDIEGDEEQEMPNIKESISNYITEAKRGRPRKVPVDGEEGGREHIVMQLRKVISLRGQKPLEFNDDSKHEIEPNVARKALDMHDSMKTASEKLSFAQRMAHSKKSFDSAVSGEKAPESKPKITLGNMKMKMAAESYIRKS